MSLDRRTFVLVGAGLAVGCERERRQVATTESPASAPSTAPTSEEVVVDAGPLSAYAQPAVYDEFRERGFFVIRRPGALFVLSSICTHKGCKVRAQADQSFACKCHGSRFSPDGKVLKGPATRDLPKLAVAVSDGQNLLVNLDRKVGS